MGESAAARSTMTSYDHRTKKIYARPDAKAVTNLLEKFAG